MKELQFISYLTLLIDITNYQPEEELTLFSPNQQADKSNEPDPEREIESNCLQAIS